MAYQRGKPLTVGLSALFAFALLAFAADAPTPQAVATLDVAKLLREGAWVCECGRLGRLSGAQRDSIPTTALFSSNNSIAVGPCPSAGYAQCSLPVVRWENGTLKETAETAHVTPQSARTSADGKRTLFDFNDRQVPFGQHLLESAHTVLTLGMSGPEDVNGEVVQVVDTSSKKACFQWRRSFPMTWTRVRSASISPSGEFVAIIEGTKLSVYRLPAACDGRRISPPPS
jgi:hypothetical protein